MAEVMHEYPKADVDVVDWLISKHREIEDEPLLLAVHFSPRRDHGNIFVFEVIERFGRDSVSPDRELFEVTYGSASFPIDPGREVHLVLTNPTELRTAVEQRWPSLLELRDAVSSGAARVVYQSRDADGLMEAIRG